MGSNECREEGKLAVRVMLALSFSSSRLGFEMVGLLLLLSDQNGRATSATLSKWHAQEGKQPMGLIVGLCCGSDTYIHSILLAKGFVSDLRKHTLVPYANAIVPVPVKTVWVHSLEIPGPWEPQVY